MQLASQLCNMNTMDVDKSVQDVQLPGPTIKIVVFKEIVFKLKYKQSEHSLSEVPFTASMQADLMKITSAILDHLLSSQLLVPLKNDYMVVYPALTTWSLVKANKLLFFCNGHTLQPHPHTVYLLVHLFAMPPPTTLSVTNQIGVGVKRPHPPDEVVLPVSTGIPHSEYMVRKKIRLDTQPAHLLEPQVPAFFSSTVPTEHAQTMPHPSSKTVSMVATVMRREFEQLSQPTAPPTDESLEVTKKDQSIMSTLWRSVKSLFGWS